MIEIQDMYSLWKSQEVVVKSLENQIELMKENNKKIIKTLVTDTVKLLTKNKVLCLFSGVSVKLISVEDEFKVSCYNTSNDKFESISIEDIFIDGNNLKNLVMSYLEDR